MKELCTHVSQKYPMVKIDVYQIVNNFFGHSITVAGLVTGKDLINQLKGHNLQSRLLIPDVMLRSEGDNFLDDVSLAEAEKELGVMITPVSSDGYELADIILSE